MKDSAQKQQPVVDRRVEDWGFMLLSGLFVSVFFMYVGADYVARWPYGLRLNVAVVGLLTAIAGVTLICAAKCDNFSRGFWSSLWDELMLSRGRGKFVFGRSLLIFGAAMTPFFLMSSMIQ